MGKILVLGACGNVGQYLCEYLIGKRGKENVIAADIYQSDPIKYLDLQFYKVDINSKESIDNLPHKDIDAVIDLVGPMPARMEGYHPEEYIQTNILGTFNVAQFCVNNNVKKMIYARSFCDILERAEDELTLKVDMTPKFDYGNYHSIYSVSQISAVEVLKCMHAFYNLDILVFRLPTIYLWSKNDIYGVKGVMQKKMYRKIIDDAIEGKPLEIWGNPNREKDMFYVKDLCRLLDMAVDSCISLGFYNAGTGIGTSLQEQIQGIVEVFDEKKKCTISYAPEKPNAPQYIMDITEARRDFGYAPSYSYLEMLRDMKKAREVGIF